MKTKEEFTVLRNEGETPNKKITELSEDALKQIAGGEIITENEYGPDDDWCRYSCGKFEFRSYADLNVSMCPQNCGNAYRNNVCNSNFAP